MNWKLWLHGLASAAIGGAATGTTQVLAASCPNPNVACTPTITTTTGIVAGAGALLTVCAYLLRSPLPAPQTPAIAPAVPPAPASDAGKDQSHS